MVPHSYQHRLGAIYSLWAPGPCMVARFEKGAAATPPPAQVDIFERPRTGSESGVQWQPAKQAVQIFLQ